MKTKKIMSAALALTLALTVAFATPITADAASVGKVKGLKVEQSNNRVVVPGVPRHKAEGQVQENRHDKEENLQR